MNFGRQALLASVLFLMAGSYGATVQLNDGRIIDGDVVRQTPLIIWLNIDGAVYEISRGDILWYSSDAVSHRILLQEGGVSAYDEAFTCSTCVNPYRSIADLSEPDHRTVHLPPQHRQAAQVLEPPARTTQARPLPAPESSAPPPDQQNQKIEPEPVNTDYPPPAPAPNEDVKLAPRPTEAAPVRGPVDSTKAAPVTPQPRTIPDYDNTGVNDNVPKLAAPPAPEGQVEVPQSIPGPNYAPPKDNSGNVPPPPVETVPPINRAPQAPPAPAPAVRESGQATFPPPRVNAAVVPVGGPYVANEADLNRLRQAIPQLSDAADPADRREAIETLRSSGDAGLAVLAEDGLYNAIPSVRARAADLLATFGGRRALKNLVEAFYSAAYPTIPPYQVQYVQTLAGAISRLTAQDYYFYARRSARAPEVAAQMLEWWDKNLDSLPPQLGEAPLDPNYSNYRDLVRLERALILIHRDFGGANLPPEIAAPAQANSPDEQQVVNLIPVIPRGADNSFADRANSGLEPAVPKIPSDALTAPGRWRDEQYIDRLRTSEIPIQQQQIPSSR